MPITMGPGTGAAVATVHVAGMTCEHCVRAVTEELTALPDVLAVRVDLAPGDVSTVAITTTTAPDDDDLRARVRAAIDEAGYDVVDD